MSAAATKIGLTLLPSDSTFDYVEPFGVKGLAELMLRNLEASGEAYIYVAYSSGNAQKLRKAADKIREASGSTFTFEKCGNEYREVSYAVTRTSKKTGATSTHEIKRQFLNVEAIKVTSVQNETDAAITADAS